MKTHNIRRVMLSGILLALTLSTIVAQPIIINRDISVFDALRLLPNRGVKIKSSYTGSGSVTVKMNGINEDAYYNCGAPIFSFTVVLPFSVDKAVPKKMLLYQTTVPAANKGSLSSGTGIAGTVYNTESFSSCVQTYDWSKLRDINTNHSIFYKRNTRTYNYMMNTWGAQPFHRIGGFKVPVKIEITFSGGMTMNDIDKFNLPGIGDISPSELLSSATPIDMYIAIGQSNMGGRAIIQSPDDVPVANAFVLSTDNDGFIPATNPLNIYSNIEKSGALTSGTNRLGPTYPFAKKMHTDYYSSQNVLYMVNARSGMSINEFLTSIKSGTGKTLIELTKDRIDEAQLAYPNATIKAILWHQGESDLTTSQSVYLTNLADAFSQLRTAVGDPNLPILVGKLAIKAGNTNDTDGINAILDQVPSSIANTYLISSAGLSTRSDIDATDADEKFHFNTASMRTLGERYATKMLDLINNAGNRSAGDNYEITTLNATDSKLEFSVYPNPSSGRINLHYPQENAGIAHVIVTDLSGKIVWERQVDFNEEEANHHLDFTSFSKGIYVLKVKTSKGDYTEQMIIR